MRIKVKISVFFIMVIMLLYCGTALSEESGTCGDQLTWKLDENRVLTISGIGRMTDKPWLKYTNIEKVMIENGCTGICPLAFYGLRYMEEIIIPDSVTEIESGAFEDCSRLTSIKLPPIREISSSLFMQCIKLKEVNIPESVVAIGISAFDGCESMIEIKLPDSVAKIENNAFFGCTGLKRITIPANLTDIAESSIPEGVIIITSENSPAAEWATSHGYPVELIPDEIPSTLSCEFDNGKYTIKNGEATLVGLVNKNVKAFTIPSAIMIGDHRFPVTIIGKNACRDMKKLTEVSIGKKVKTIGENAFASCTKLKTVKGGSFVTIIKDAAFSNCKALQTIPTFSRLQTIGSNAFKKCIGLLKITLAENVKSIGKNAFYGCKALKEIAVKTSKLKSSRVKDGAFKGISSKAVFKCPQKKVKEYKKMFLKVGAPGTCVFK